MSNTGHAIIRTICHANSRLATRSQSQLHIISSSVRQPLSNTFRQNFLATNFFLRCRQTRAFSASPTFDIRNRGPVKIKDVPQLDQSRKKHDANEGVPLPTGDLSKEELSTIVGPDLDPETGNKLLRIIQWRRLSGTLNDREISPLPESESDRKVYEKALKYLRARFPVNERHAERAWAVEEAKRLEAELRGIDEAKVVYGPQQGPSKHAKSHLQEMMKNAEAKAQKRRKETEKMRQMEMEKLRAEGKQIAVLQPPLALATTFDMPVRVKSPELQRYIERGTLTFDAEAVKMSAWQRLWPTTLFAGIFIGACVYFANVYTPPDPSARLWPNTPPAIATCYGLLLLNLGVFLMWRFPPLWRFMNTYFVHTPGYPVALSCLGNVISHQTLFHLFNSILVLMLLGPNLHETVGRGNFLAIWFASGVFGGWVSLATNTYLHRFITSGLGASGANAGMFAAYCTLNTNPVVSTIFIPDYNAHIWSPLLLAGLIAVDLYCAIRRRQSHLDHFTHLGGYFSGIVAGLALQNNKAVKDKRTAGKKKQEMEFVKNTVK